MATNNEKTVWLVVTDDHRYDTAYDICDSVEAAHKLFEMIVRENYFDGTPEEEEILQEQLESKSCGFWDYTSDFVSFYACNILTLNDVLKIKGESL